MYTRWGVARYSGILPAVTGTVADHRIKRCILHNPHFIEKDSDIDHQDYERSCKEAGMLFYIPEPVDLRR